MKVAQLITVVLLLCIAFPRSIQPKRKTKPKKFCVGKDGNRYKVGEGYDDNKENICIYYKCVKKKNKFIMKKGKCGDKTLIQATVETCDDAGCKNAFNGLGLCMDTASVNWADMSKIIDFSAGTKEGKCSKDCNCNCFKHTGCYSNKCDQLSGICFIPDQEEKRGFFIPDEYKKAFPCDESLNCHCFIKNYDGATRPSAAATETPKHPINPITPACPPILTASTSPTTECPVCPSTPEATTNLSTMPTCPPPPECPSLSPSPKYTSTPSPSTLEASSHPSTTDGPSETTTSANMSAIQGCYQNYNFSEGERETISSPGFGNQSYPNNLTCRWTFTAQPGEKVSMTIFQMNTEYGYDVVRVLDGISEDDDKLPILATMSGDEKKQEAIISTTSEMTITFTSDVNINMTGFQATVVTFKRADLPQFVWNDLYSINMKYPTGENETIALSLVSDDKNICVFEGATSETTVIITSPSSTEQCKSLDQHIEIMVTSIYLGGNKRIYTIKNGLIRQIDLNIFENNGIGRKRNVTKDKVPTKLRIPLQFAYEDTLVNKFKKYGQDKSYIEKRLLETYHGAKFNLKNILNETDVEFTLEKRMIYINKELKVNDTTLMEMRKYQLREDIPIVIFCAEDYHSNVKGLSFRSGACRKDRERFGVIMLTWRDDGGLVGDVLEHELAHLIGGVHNQKNSTETYLGLTEFNSENIIAWFQAAGDRCYGKNCSSPPNKPHGTWSCDTELQNCYLECDWGFSTVSSTTIQCENGKWSHNIDEMACTPSVFLLVGGLGNSGFSKDVEIFQFHPHVKSLNCPNRPPTISQKFYGHTTFIHRGNLYLCGGVYTERTCSTYTQGNKWSTHLLQEKRYGGHSSVVIGDALFMIGGISGGYGGYPEVEETKLPFLTETPTWSLVPDMPYKGKGQCAVKFGINSFVVTGGEMHDVYFNSTILYNIVDKNSKMLATLIQSRNNHGCLMLNENGDTFIIVTGGESKRGGEHYLKSTEILKLSDSKSKWKSISDLNKVRVYHEMALTTKGPIVVGGYRKSGYVKSVELLNLQTEKWTQIETSLSNPRFRFGGVVEHPGNLFNCELNENTGSVYLIAGGNGAAQRIEMYHPTIEHLKCTITPPPLSDNWAQHKTFYHDNANTIYLCGGISTKSTCISYTKNMKNWKTHTLPSPRYYGHSTVVLENTLYIIGGVDTNSNDFGVVSTPLPLTDQPVLTSVPKLSYKGHRQCVAKVDSNNFITSGGQNNDDLSTVIQFNAKTSTAISLPSLNQARRHHGCVVAEVNKKKYLIVTGGYHSHSGYLRTTEIIDLEGKIHVSVGNLKTTASTTSLVSDKIGVLAIGGYVSGDGATNIVELLDWETKRWKQWKQSIKYARYLYGGTVKIPSSLFDCKGCPNIPAKDNGKWMCDNTKMTCILKCNPGFSSLYTTATCTEGVWRGISNMECGESVFIVAGGRGDDDSTRKNVEIFHPEISQIKCSNPPPPLDLDFSSHTSFTYQGTLYLCGGVRTKGDCMSYSESDNTWSHHSLEDYRGWGLSSAVVADTPFLLGGRISSFLGVKETKLPFLIETPTWSQVPNMPYKGQGQCAVKSGVNSFIVTGGAQDNDYFNTTTMYNIEDQTSEALAPLIQKRRYHGCLVMQENEDTWIIVTGGYGFGGYGTGSEILNLSDGGSKWKSIDGLNWDRYGHGMALSGKGPIVLGGENNGNRLKSVELLIWETKKWMLIESSLVIPRSYYGGVLELPGYLFGCETQPIIITGCSGEYEYNKEFTGGKSTPVGQNETCHSVCQNDDNCLAWTWTNRNCLIITLQSHMESLQPNIGSISGFKNACKPRCCLVLSDEDEASTSTQFCNSEENTGTDCFDMIHLEPDDFQEGDEGRIKMCHQEDGKGYCEDVKYKDVHLLCNPDPGMVTLSTRQRINKHFFTRHLGPSFGK